MSEFIELASYPNELEAELAQATLAAAGIDSMLKMDDIGGMLPVFQSVRGVALLVKAEDEEEAKTILSTQAASPPTEN